MAGQRPGPAHLRRARVEHRLFPHVAGNRRRDRRQPRSTAAASSHLLEQTGPVQRDALYWHYPHYWGGNRVRPFGAVRAGDWKLIEFYEDMRVELYNLKDDLGEARDLAESSP